MFFLLLTLPKDSVSLPGDGQDNRLRALYKKGGRACQKGRPVVTLLKQAERTCYWCTAVQNQLEPAAPGLCCNLLKRKETISYYEKPILHCSVQMLYHEFTDCANFFYHRLSPHCFKYISVLQEDFLKKMSFSQENENRAHNSLFWGDLHFPEWHCNKLPLTDNIAENKINMVPTIWLGFVGCVHLALLP